MTTFPETPDIETSSEDYARRFSGAVGAWFLGVQERATLDLLAPFPGATIVDVGGGHGQVTRPLIERGHPVTVLGSTDACSARIQPLLDRNGCSFKVGNLLELPYPDRSFDVVLSYRLLPHVVEWKRLLSELARVAKRAVIFDYPTTRSLNYFSGWLFGLKKRIEGNTRTFTCFAETDLLDQLHVHGFQRSGRFAEFFFPMVLHRTLRFPFLSAAMEGAARLCGVTHLLGSPVILRVDRKEP